MAQTNFPVFEPYMERTLDSGMIQVCFAVSEEQFCTIQSYLYQNKLYFSCVQNLEKIFSQIEIQANCFEIRKCLGCTNVQVLSWHTFLSVADISADKKFQKSIFETLARETGLDFKKGYAGLLGAFEIYQMPEWSEDAEPPFSLSLRGPEAIPTEPKQRNCLVFRRRTDFAQKKHYLSLKLYAGESLIYDRLHVLEAGKTQLGPIITEEHFNRESCVLYDDQGNLIHEEDFPLMDSIGFGISLGGPTVKLAGDKAGQRANSLGKYFADRMNTVQTSSMPKNSIVTLFNTQYVRQHLHTQKWYASSLFDKERNSSWFANSNENNMESLLHIRDLICGYDSKYVILVDPFFDKTAFMDLIFRITTRRLPVTILTNLLSREEKQSGVTIDDWAELLDLAEKNKRLIHCDFAIYNVRLVEELNSRSFHDRYLVIHRGENIVDAYLLSNNINSRSRNFPFCIAKINCSTSMLINNYLESIIKSQYEKFDITQYWKNYG